MTTLDMSTVLTNGVFDILHAGHLSYLSEASKMGDRFIVAINDDSSVKRLKGSRRPINSCDLRKRQLELLPFIDEVIVFSGENAAKVIEQLLPTIYVKGSDYKGISTPETRACETLRIECRYIDFQTSTSTSSIIQKIEDTSQSKALFLDRDGVIIRDLNYLCDPDLIVFNGPVLNLMKRAQNLGFLNIMITNQSGIGRGYFTLKEYHKFESKLVEKLRHKNIFLSGIQFCPHSPSENCNCRKPRPGMFIEAAKNFNIDLSRSISIGDKLSDRDAAVAAGLKCHYNFKENKIFELIGNITNGETFNNELFRLRF